MVRSRAPRQSQDPFEARVENLTHDGRGVVHVGGKAVFVPGALAGERIRLSVSRRRRKYDEGRLHAVLEPSPERVSPRCPHFGVCGGCALQHLSSHGQIEHKQQQFLETLRRVGRVEPEAVAPPLRAGEGGEAWGYRRRARIAVQSLSRKKGVIAGFRKQKESAIAALEGCDILEPVVGARIRVLRDVLTRLSIRSRIPYVEVAVGDNATALVLRTLSPPSPGDREVLRGFGADSGVWIHLQGDGQGRIEPLSPQAPPLYYDLPEFGLRLYFEPTDFIQVNAAMNRALVKRAVDWLAPGPDERVLDLFSGLGNFSLPLACRAGEVVAVEGDAELVKRGRENARCNSRDNLAFETDDVLQPGGSMSWLKAGSWPEAGFDKVLLDPPRSGARDVLSRILNAGPREIVYVSCHPATLARDVGYLVHEAGYRLGKVSVVDMFPHTAHVEALALLTRSS